MAAMLMSPVLCPHWRLPENCQDCKLRAALEAGLGVPEPVLSPPLPPEERADHDVYLDHGRDGLFTLVVKGDPIPRRLADLPRVPVKRGVQTDLTATSRKTRIRGD